QRQWQEQESQEQRIRDKQPLLNNNHKSNIIKNFLQMANEQMLFPYRNTTRQFKEMEMQGIPVTMANLAIHRQREEKINQERMRYERILQEAATQQAREANKGKSREVVLDCEDEFVSSESEEF
ncbi:hypothetical protein PIB30_102688, partial [Stylosanthes scabra]|nr:hypothetical protein [Stylosanthes scabra]